VLKRQRSLQMRLQSHPCFVLLLVGTRTMLSCHETPGVRGSFHKERRGSNGLLARLATYSSFRPN
jgi:hypothetical protein